MTEMMMVGFQKSTDASYFVSKNDERDDDGWISENTDASYFISNKATPVQKVFFASFSELFKSRTFDVHNYIRH